MRYVFEGVGVCVVFVDGVESRWSVGGYRLWAVCSRCRRVCQLLASLGCVGIRMPSSLQLAVAINVLLAMLKVVRG